MRHHPGDFKSIGCEVGKLRSAMSPDQLADRHKPARGINAAKVGVSVYHQSGSPKRESLRTAEIRAHSAHPAEHPCKVLLRFETAAHCDAQDTRLVRPQH